MPRYNVYVSNVVSTSIEVEARDADEAADLVFETDRSLGLMFLDHKYPDMGDWEVSEVGLIGN